MAEDRRRRPELSRLGPNRELGKILGAASRVGNPDEPPEAQADHEPRGDFIADGVRAAYQVVDAYIDQGQQIARKLRQPKYDSIGKCPSNLLDPLGLLDRSDDLGVRWVEASAELLAIWAEFLGSAFDRSALGSRKADDPQTAVADEGVPSSVPSQPPVESRFEIRSRLYASAGLEFLPNRETTRLATHGLRSLGGESLDPIDVEVDLQPDGKTVAFKISVPEEHPPGLYTGAVLDSRSGEGVGTLSLRLR